MFIREVKHQYSVPRQYSGKWVELRYNQALLKDYSSSSKIAPHLLSVICLKTQVQLNAEIRISFYGEVSATH
jgi:hypothetical protein